MGFLFGKRKKEVGSSSNTGKDVSKAVSEREAIAAIKNKTKIAAAESQINQPAKPPVYQQGGHSQPLPSQKIESETAKAAQPMNTAAPALGLKSGSIVDAVNAQNKIQNQVPEAPVEKPARKINSIQFRTLASDRPNRNAVNDTDYERARLKLREIFAPSAPVLNKEHFAGRTEELERAISSIENERMHLVIYGKRGWGKTSFTNTLSNIAAEAGYIVCRASCSSDIKYSDIFRNFLSEIPLIHDSRFISGHTRELSKETLARHLPEGDFGPRELTEAVANMTATRAIFVLDEYDRAQDPNLTTALAETLKNFSDRAVRVSIIIVGVADTLGEMLGAHESIRRNIVGLPMRLLSSPEFDELLDIGEAATRVEFPAGVRARLSNLSRQVPYFTRLLCLHAGQSALSHERWNVTNVDVDYAKEQALFDTKPLLSRYHRRLIEDADNAVLKSFLISIARVKTNDKGDFTVAEVLDEYQKLTGTVVSKLSVGSRLSLLAKEEIAFVTKFERDHKLFYRLTDPLTGFYLRLRYENEV
ncbi:AAA family ATPase [Kordiimonas sp. SCSIO 12610]|uniref:AAA family ATPase n=1 Tax=Kordiimonas sp. SCSIO 12610 TaxID=2829597 RepID=UPI00210DF18E|nr:AAA family ATPase [Kordiimonas sp. SCSIO 12610]UTW55867.1 orc1/cdc6 family replication initiation protein [Kordiimonas sp. SCSIO 12610]